MDRLETKMEYNKPRQNKRFIFQYGQIRNEEDMFRNNEEVPIYIPVWIDQKPKTQQELIEAEILFIFQYGQIRNGLMKN